MSVPLIVIIILVSASQLIQYYGEALKNLIWGGLTTAGRATVGFTVGAYNPVHFFPISTGSYIYIIIRTIGENKNKNRAFFCSYSSEFFVLFRI